MKTTTKAVLLAALLASAGAQAETAKPDYETTFNAGVVSDYRFRGISQTRLKPALQGGIDAVHNPSGWYAGAWASTIRWTTDAGGDGSVEIDVYGGKRGQLAPDATYDVGVLAYIYPSNGLARVPGFDNAHTVEVYGALNLGPGYIKYSHSLTNAFAFVDSRRSGYLDLGANLDLGGVTLNLHAGHQRIKNTRMASYSDYKVGLTRDFGGFSGSIAVVGTNARRAAYTAPNGKFTGKTGVVLGLTKTF